MCVSSILVVGKDCNLDHEGTDWFICSLKRQQMGEKEIFKKCSKLNFSHVCAKYLIHLF